MSLQTSAFLGLQGVIGPIHHSDASVSSSDSCMCAALCVSVFVVTVNGGLCEASRPPAIGEAGTDGRVGGREGGRLNCVRNTLGVIQGKPQHCSQVSRVGARYSTAI